MDVSKVEAVKQKAPEEKEDNKDCLARKIKDSKDVKKNETHSWFR